MNLKHIRNLQLNAVQQAMQNLYEASRKHTESMRRGQNAETWLDLRTFFTISVKAPARSGATTWLDYLAAKHLHEYPGTTVVRIGQPADCHRELGPRHVVFPDAEGAMQHMKGCPYLPSLVLIDGNVLPSDLRWIWASMHDPEADLPQYVVHVQH